MIDEASGSHARSAPRTTLLSIHSDWRSGLSASPQDPGEPGRPWRRQTMDINPLAQATDTQPQLVDEAGAAEPCPVCLEPGLPSHGW